MPKRKVAAALASLVLGCAAPAAPPTPNGLDFQGLSGLDAASGKGEFVPATPDGALDAALADTATAPPDVVDATVAEGSGAEFGPPADAASQASDTAVGPDADRTDVADPDPVDGDPDAPVADATADGADGGSAPDLDLGGEAPDSDGGSDGQPQAETQDGTAGSWSPPLGGAPGSGCYGQDGAVTCSPDGKYRVECNNGAWTALQHCGFGLCSASLSPGGGVATTCGVPKAKHAAANDACARYSKCFGGPGHEACVRGVLAPGPFAAGLTKGKALSVADLAFTGIAENLSCAAAATTCAALGECLYFFAQPKCTSAPAGCSGDVAWQCLSGVPLAVHCKALAMACTAGGGAAHCIAAGPCTPASAVTCMGGVATKCSTLADGKSWTEKVDCATVVGACQQGAGSISGACAGPPDYPCVSKDFVASCKDGAALTCVGGDTLHTPCGPGLVCAVENQFALFEKSCPEGQGCNVAVCTEGGSCSAKAKCNGSEVWFCEAKQPAAYDCKAKGMTCALAPGGPRCQ
ncbi:MAG: hypothetical protein FJ100_07975 [Deltaproteobacteria bacterium]|nr:hypothetical protein [Deltaproteobacteria bacterium]